MHLKEQAKSHRDHKIYMSVFLNKEYKQMCLLHSGFLSQLQTCSSPKNEYYKETYKMNIIKKQTYYFYFVVY